MQNRQIFLLILLAVIAGLGLWVVKPFLTPMVWAGILSFVTWPVYRRLLQLLKGRRTAGSLIMTTLLITLLIMPVLWLLIRLQGELADAYKALSFKVSEGPLHLPDAIARIPLIGPAATELLTAYWNDPALWKQQLKDWLEPWIGEFAGVIGKIGRSLLDLVFAGLTLFFFFRDGETIVTQAREGLRKLIGDPADAYFKAIGETTNAVVSGLIVTALVQGLIAGIGFKITGVGTPVLLGALTTVTSLIPLVGTVIVWAPIGVWMLLSGKIGAGVGLLAWGAIVVHPADNILRPYLISKGTDIPLLIVFFGVAGGLLAFGLVGLFIGPLILTVLLAIWREWLGGDAPPTP